MTCDQRRDKQVVLSLLKGSSTGLARKDFCCLCKNEGVLHPLRICKILIAQGLVRIDRPKGRRVLRFKALPSAW